MVNNENINKKQPNKSKAEEAIKSTWPLAASSLILLITGKFSTNA